MSTYKIGVDLVVEAVDHDDAEEIVAEMIQKELAVTEWQFTRE